MCTSGTMQRAVKTLKPIMHAIYRAVNSNNKVWSTAAAVNEPVSGGKQRNDGPSGSCSPFVPGIAVCTIDV
jgi:hypothetical protein